MTYICLDCGHHFDEGEQAQFKEAHGERYSACPVCGGDYEKAEWCRQCKGDFLADKVYGGYCRECLEGAIDYDTGLRFLEDKGLLADFIIGAYFESEVPESTSATFNLHLLNTFKRLKAEEILMNRNNLLQLLRRFILDDEGDTGKELFAKWLTECEEKGK